MPVAAFNEIARALARGKASVQLRRFIHAGKSYIAYQGAVPGFQPGTLVATGYAFSVVADDHQPAPEELAAALDIVESGRSSRGARDGT
jgi:hypothetical protein